MRIHAIIMRILEIAKKINKSQQICKKPILVQKTKYEEAADVDIRLKWFYRLGFLFLLFIVFFIFMKLKPMWGPVVSVATIILLPFVIGAFISYLLHPIVEALHRAGMKRGLSVTIIYLLFFGGIGFGLYKGIPAMINQIQELSENAPSLIKQYKTWVEMLHHQTSNWPFGIQERIEKD